MITPLAQRLALVFASLAVGLLALELGLRAWGGWLGHWSNLVLEARTVHAEREGARFLHDDRVGYVPRLGLRGSGDAPAGDATRSLLAVGDSFTYGDEVADGETWPAHLQRLTGRHVLNGGVSGYGLDQSVLHAETLAKALQPSAIVIGFIADDIRRTELRRLWGAEKPYFDLDGEALVLRNVPVPPRPEPAGSLSFWQRTLGHSLLFDFVLRRLDLLHDWFGDHVRVHPPGTGARIACGLAGRLAALQATSGARVLLLAQYDAQAWRDPGFVEAQRKMVAGVLACARRQGLGAVDSFDATAAWTGAGGPAGLYGLWHMNNDGNRLIAGIVASALSKDGK